MRFHMFGRDEYVYFSYLIKNMGKCITFMYKNDKTDRDYLYKSLMVKDFGRIAQW